MPHIWYFRRKCRMMRPAINLSPVNHNISFVHVCSMHIETNRFNFILFCFTFIVVCMSPIIYIIQLYVYIIFLSDYYNSLTFIYFIFFNVLYIYIYIYVYKFIFVYYSVYDT